MRAIARGLAAVGLLTAVASVWHMVVVSRHPDGSGANGIRARPSPDALAGDAAEFNAYETEALLRTHLGAQAEPGSHAGRSWQFSDASAFRPAHQVDAGLAKLALAKLGPDAVPRPPPAPPGTPARPRKTVARMKFTPMPKPDDATRCDEDAHMKADGEAHATALRQAWRLHVAAARKTTRTYCLARCPLPGSNFSSHFLNRQLKKQLVPSPRTWLPAEGLVCCQGAEKTLSDFGILSEGLDVHDDGVSDVTLVTQGSSNRIHALNSTLLRWPGPVVAVFSVFNNSAETRGAAPGQLRELAAATAEWARGRKNVRIIVVVLQRPVGQDFISAQMKTMGQLGLYPVNAMRNRALDEARTNWVFPNDMDFIPSAQLYEMLRSTHLPKLSQVRKQTRACAGFFACSCRCARPASRHTCARLRVRWSCWHG